MWYININKKSASHLINGQRMRLNLNAQKYQTNKQTNRKLS